MPDQRSHASGIPHADAGNPPSGRSRGGRGARRATRRVRASLGCSAIRTAILTVSTTVSRRNAEDRSGPVLAGLAEAAGCEIVAMEVVPDDFGLIEDRLHHYVDDDCDLVFTTGGTGMTPDDITPEATQAVIHREAPGLAEAMRAEAARQVATGILSRGVSGIAEATLIVNFPGSPRAVEQLFPVIAPVLAHAVATLRGDSAHGHRHGP